MSRFHRNTRGFTLIELMVVIAILSMLAVLVVPKIVGHSDDAKITDAQVQIRNLETALKMYKLDNGVYPETEQGLQALVIKPTTGTEPRKYREGGYLESKNVPKDPWGNDYVYLSPGEHGDYDLYSFGPDGARGGEGKKAADIESWNMQ
ncbi:type II secretion system protein GspG [bacterium]|nr:type II secretion system protein GspG [bacterium]